MTSKPEVAFDLGGAGPSISLNIARTLMHRTSALVACLLATLLVAGEAAAQAPQFLGSFRDWFLYSYDEAGGKTCYIASKPTTEAGNWNRRGPAAVLVSRLPIPGAGEQVSVQPGYPFKANSTAQLKIGNQEWQLFTQGEHAWANTDDEDQAIVRAMQRGSDMTVRGTSQLDTYSLDTYSLLGFTAAFEAMRDACPD